MLHAHVPESLQHFGKHLFATFLGLLMALGLEQWAVHHHEARIAREALSRVEAELEKDLETLTRQDQRAKASMKTLDAVDAFLVVQMEAKRAGRPVEERLPEGELGVGIGFTTDAWESLKLTGAFRNLSLDQAERLSTAYSFLHDFVINAKVYAGQERLNLGMVLLTAPQRRFKDFEIRDFQELRQSLWLLRDYFRWVDQELGWMKPSIEKALHA